jgi:hypothetical protein
MRGCLALCGCVARREGLLAGSALHKLAEAAGLVIVLLCLRVWSATGLLGLLLGLRLGVLGLKGSRLLLCGLAI